MSQIHRKGSNLSVGNIVTIKISHEHHASTEIFGEITGLRLWSDDRIAVEIAGISDWIILNDRTEVGLV